MCPLIFQDEDSDMICKYGVVCDCIQSVSGKSKSNWKALFPVLLIMSFYLSVVCKVAMLTNRALRQNG